MSGTEYLESAGLAAKEPSVFSRVSRNLYAQDSEEFWFLIVIPGRLNGAESCVSAGIQLHECT